MVPAEKKEVRLKIRSSIQEGQEISKQLQEVPGQLYLKEEQMYLRYEEELEGIGPIQNTIKVEEGSIRIIRHGGIRMNHLYQQGKLTQSVYHTPHGPFEMVTETTQIDVLPFRIGRENTEKGRIFFCYELTLNQEKVGVFQLDIEINQVDKQ